MIAIQMPREEASAPGLAVAGPGSPTRYSAEPTHASSSSTFCAFLSAAGHCGADLNGALEPDGAGERAGGVRGEEASTLPALRMGALGSRNSHPARENRGQVRSDRALDTIPTGRQLKTAEHIEKNANESGSQHRRNLVQKEGVKSKSAEASAHAGFHITSQQLSETSISQDPSAAKPLLSQARVNETLPPPNTDGCGEDGNGLQSRARGSHREAADGPEPYRGRYRAVPFAKHHSGAGSGTASGIGIAEPV